MRPLRVPKKSSRPGKDSAAPFSPRGTATKDTVLGQYSRRASRDRSAGKRRAKQRDSLKPKLDPALGPVFRKIGVPEPEPLKPDPFQLEALHLIQERDVLVSAPTGAGKTWIASQAIEACLSKDQRVWYASPLKALSNSIYGQFCREFGSPSCGILTGDRKENPDAPVLVGTTEILRNQLYDAMQEGTSIRADLVILDEAHYLSDPERGVVWEEVLIYLPSRVRLLLLSATISNAEEVCRWLKEIRGAPNQVVYSEQRPVSLEMIFLLPDGRIVPLGGRRGLNSKVKKYLDSQKTNRHGKINLGEVIRCLRAFDLLPAIFFLKSRIECDRAVVSCPPAEKPPETKARLKQVAENFLRDYPHLIGHRQMNPLLSSMVGAHHAGQLPYWKVLIEKMMNEGHLEAIFSTSTVAAGVNFPARTVVLVQSDRYNGREFIDLTATDLHQMIGRAGRRGKDQIGFALVVPTLHQDPQLIYELKESPAEPILSQIHINFSMTLNLLLSHRPFEVRHLLEKSFAAFQQAESSSFLRRRWNEMLLELRESLPRGKCDTGDPLEVLDNIQRRRELERELKKLKKSFRYDQLTAAYREYLNPGRLIRHKNGRIYMVFRTSLEEGRLVCAAFPVKKISRRIRSGFKASKVELDQIRNILDYRVDVSPEDSLQKLQGRLKSIVLSEDLDALPINLEKFDGSNMDQERSYPLPCEECEHFQLCHGHGHAAFTRLLRGFRSFAVRLDEMEEGLWLSFKRHVRFLKETGFVDHSDRLTPDGYWASKLRLDQPLLIAEAIRRGALDGVSPERMAGGLAAFVWDRSQELELRVGEAVDLAELEEVFARLLDSLDRIRELKRKRGFETPPIPFWPSVALFLWAKGMPWDRVLSLLPVDEGDMASLVMRTADHLRQVANLRDTHPQLAHAAEEAIELIQREPVYIS